MTRTELLLTIIVVQFILIVALLVRQHGARPMGDAVLKYPIGVSVAGVGKTDFYELIPAGQRLPSTRSQSFTTVTSEQQSAQIAIAQQRPDGTETIVDVVVPVPPRSTADAKVVITISVSRDKKLLLKGTVVDSGVVKNYGPYPVE